MRRGRLIIACVAPLACALAQERHTAPVMDNKIYTMLLADQLEHDFDAESLRFNAQAWIGGDYNRVWINTEGAKVYDGELEDADVQVLYGRLIAPFWDFQVGGRYFRPHAHAPSRGSAVIGVQGLAPYWFEVQAATFISHKGEVSFRVEAEHDMLLAQRLIAQPRAETNIAVQSVPEMGIARGFNDLEIGLRVRYEIRREIAPYIGVVWTNVFGGAADFARSRNDAVRSLGIVVGVRIWR